MPDYMYLLESRLTPEQRAVMERVQELSRAQDVNVYLTGGAVRDLISGMPIRDLDFTVEGNPVKMVRELEKGGARVVWESEKLRHHEVIFAGDVDGSISAAREDHYERPGVKPEYRFSSIMEDLKRRDIGINAIAISLNTQSRGLLLDPMNGLADLEKQEIRVLSIHAFTNQPIRLMRTLRYAARMNFKMEPRTQEWFDLAMERGLVDRIESGDVGHEIARHGARRQCCRHAEAMGIARNAGADSSCAAETKAGLRQPEQAGASALRICMAPVCARGCIWRSPITPREAQRSRSGFGAAQSWNIARRKSTRSTNWFRKRKKSLKMLKSPKTNAPKDAYYYLASVPAEALAFIETEMPNSKALSKIRNYLQKWRPLRMASPAAGTRGAGRRARPEIRQDHRPVLRDATARQGQDSRRPHQDSEESCRT